jgi:hypothetical protein
VVLEWARRAVPRKQQIEGNQKQRAILIYRELANGSKHGHGQNKPNGIINAEEKEKEKQEPDLNLLLKYDIIIIDEAHERTLNTDFLCGALKKIQRLRKELHASNTRLGGRKVTELKLVIMSATLDPTKFRNFFETYVLFRFHSLSVAVAENSAYSESSEL